MNTTTKARTAKAAPKAKGAPKAAPVRKARAKKAPAVDVKAKPTTADTLRAAAERYVHDKEHKTAGGNVSIHNGDKVAVMLLGKSLDEVYAIATKTLKEDEAGLRAKYAHLNVGQQRMCLGNRMRPVVKGKEAKK